MELLIYLANERKKDLETDYWTDNKESLPLKRKEKLEEKKEIKEDILQTCKACKKTFDDTSMLRHLSQNKSCKDTYNEKEWKYITGWANES